VFCLQCGAEAPARAVLCPTCGHDLGRSSADLRSSLALADVPLEAGVSLPGPAIVMASPSIRAGDLDRPGLPQDTPGRVLLVVLLVMAGTLFLPWSTSFGQHYTLSQAVGFAIVFLLLLAGLPLMHPKLRRNTVSAALPILIGGICLGLGLTYWGRLIQMQLDQPGPQSTGIVLVSPAEPDFGLFGFLIGAVVLAIVGYYVLVDAVREPFLISASQKASAAMGALVRPGASAVPAAVGEPAPAGTAKESSPGAANSEQQGGKSSNDAVPQIVLPGSDAWTRTLEPPTFVRSKLGGIRRTNR